MEIIKEKQKKYKYVEDGETTITKYKSLNGNVYNTEKDCLEMDKMYLRKLAYDSLSKLSFDSLDIPEFWYCAKNNEELDLVKHEVYWYDKNAMFNDEKISSKTVLNMGDWVGYIVDYGGDYPDSFRIYTLDYVKKKVDEFFEKFV